jgi:serpin B
LAATATNTFGVDLYHRLARGDSNLCFSPYSIQSALAMVFVGAAGTTRAEMARVLHYPTDADTIHLSFASLRSDLARRQVGSEAGNTPEIIVANRMFPQVGYAVRDAFRALLTRYYEAAFEPLDFKANPDVARTHINRWVADRTHDRIRDVIPPGGVGRDTRFVVAAAIYLKARWNDAFLRAMPRPFHIRGGRPVEVPMMDRTSFYGYAKREGFTVVALPYIAPYVKSGLQFVVVVPDDPNGLHAVEAKLSAELLGQFSKLDKHYVHLGLPRFRLEVPPLTLGRTLRALGMVAALDPRTADFTQMAPPVPDAPLFLSEVVHKTFISVDESGTEAAAATIEQGIVGGRAPTPPPPIEVTVDRPFLYAIQHVPSGACLFVGRVTDPRPAS